MYSGSVSGEDLPGEFCTYFSTRSRKQSHNFTTFQFGLAFLGVILGGILGFLTSPIQDYLYSRSSRRNDGNPRPEARLYFSCGGTLMIASGLFWFGWTSGPDIPWIVPILAIGWIIIGIYTVYVSIFSSRDMTDHRLLHSIILQIRILFMHRQQ